MSKQPIRLHYVVPTELQEKIRLFAQENEFRNEREALAALIEGALDAWPKWGVRKGIARQISSSVRAAVRNRVIAKLGEVAQEIAAEVSEPTQDEMVMDPNAGFID